MKRKIISKISSFLNTHCSDDSKEMILSFWIKEFQQRNNHLMKKHLLPLRNKYSGKRAFILGNGPSLKNTDVRLLKNEITIACNGIFFLFEETGFSPTFYTVEDNLIAEQWADTINNLRGTIKIFPYDLRSVLKQDENTLYINFLRLYPFFPQFSTDFDDHVFWGGTVSYLNIQLAYYLGISEVYLIGFDNNYVIPQKDIKTEKGILSQSLDNNHFNPNYFGPGHRYNAPNFELMDLMYNKVQSFCDKTGWRVYNATAGGKFDVFERCDYNSLF